MEPFEYIDILAGSPPGQGGSRWDRGDTEGAIRTLDVVLAKAGLPGALAPAMKVLDRVERLVLAGRMARDEAQAKLDKANMRLLDDGDIPDLEEYARVLNECAPWISDDAPASAGVGDAGRQIRMRATMVTFGMVGSLYQQLSDHCRDVVTAIAGVPAPPPDVWQTQARGEAGSVMIRHDLEADWAAFVRLSDSWNSIHEAGRLLRESGQLQAELLFDAGPTELCMLFLNWEAAQTGENLQLLPGPLRVRRAVDLGWRPGLWTKHDHEAFVAEQRDKPKRSLVGAFLGRGAAGNPPSVSDEFSA